MDRNSDKLHHLHECHDSRELLKTYFSGNHDFIEDVIKLPIEKLKNAFKTGDISGNILNDISATATVHHLFSATDCFQEIILMRPNKKCIMEILKWQKDDSGAFSWGHMAEHDPDTEEKSDKWEVKEMKLKSTIKQVVPFDTEAEPQKDLSGVPQADCVITALLCDLICKNEDDYVRIMRKILEQLKPGGYLILFGVVDASYYTLGEKKFHLFTYDEKLVKNTLAAEGMSVLQSEVFPRKSKSNLIDYKSVLFLMARKQK
ncbi:indolethylamine N-methyltransferase-like [Hyperolius riggenbachi]|uniref:indolethylamine N-methyltransferase-like n=1 Tax=Hyperolius riggenbachi TaxID=752182 RepID=UPI0035A2D0BB